MGNTKRINPVVKILMKRDGMDRQEAEDLVRECQEDLENGNYTAIQDWLGLEDDYIFDVLDF